MVGCWAFCFLQNPKHRWAAHCMRSHFSGSSAMSSLPLWTYQKIRWWKQYLWRISSEAIHSVLKVNYCKTFSASPHMKDNTHLHNVLPWVNADFDETKKEKNNNCSKIKHCNNNSWSQKLYKLCPKWYVGLCPFNREGKWISEGLHNNYRVRCLI